MMMMQEQSSQQHHHILDVNGSLQSQSTPPSSGTQPQLLQGRRSPPLPPPPPPPIHHPNWGLHLSDLEKAYSPSALHHHPHFQGVPLNGEEESPYEGRRDPPEPPAVPSSAASKKSTSRRNAWGNLSYADLITQAINSAPEKRLTLSQVYEWMVQNIPYFKDKGDSNSSAGWKNSIRHNLSLHNRFVRVQNEGTGKSSWWMINPDAKQNGGKSTRRRASTLVDGKSSNEPTKRRGRKQKPGFVTDLLAAGQATRPSSPNHNIPPADLYGGPPESPGYQYSSFNAAAAAATDLRVGRSEYNNDMSPPVRHDPYSSYSDWSPEYSTVQGGYFSNNMNRGPYCEPPPGVEGEIPRNMSPIRSNGFAYRGNFANGRENFRLYGEKDSPIGMTPHSSVQENVPQNYSNLQVMSPSENPVSPSTNPRHQFSSECPPPNSTEPLLSPVPPQNTAFFPPSHHPPDSPAGGRAGSSGSSTGSILERALASSVKQEQQPGSPHHLNHRQHLSEQRPPHPAEWAAMGQHHFGEVEDFMKHEYGIEGSGNPEYAQYAAAAASSAGHPNDKRPPTEGPDPPPSSTPVASQYQPFNLGPPWVR